MLSKGTLNSNLVESAKRKKAREFLKKGVLISYEGVMRHPYRITRLTVKHEDHSHPFHLASNKRMN